MQIRPTRVAAILLSAILALGACAVTTLLLVQQAAANPQGKRCGAPGPLPPLDIYCGCTWGGVFFRGERVMGAQVTLTFGISVLNTTTQFGNVPPSPYFAFQGFDHGLRKNDIATVTAQYNGQTVSRVFRSRPDDIDLDGGQEINLVIPDVGQWTSEASTGYTLALKIVGNEIWMGGTNGLQHHLLPSGNMMAEDTGLNNGIAALAEDAQGRVWSLGVYDQVAMRTGSTWTTMTTGLTGTQRAMALASDGSLWAGGDSGLSRYDGTTWQVQPDFNGALANMVMALHTARDGSLWVATWKGGVSRLANGTWTSFTVSNSGINSDRVGGLTETDAGIWFALADYTELGHSYGGLSVYSPTIAAWQTYTNGHGLPTNIRSVAAAGEGIPWVSSLGSGVAHMIQNSTPITFTIYNTSNGLRSNVTSRIATSGTHVFVATDAGIDRFDARLLGVRPVAAITQVTPTLATSQSVLFMEGSGSDLDNDDRILGYEWTSDLGEPVCSLVTCTLPSPTTLLKPGQRTLWFRVLDDEGMWSAPVKKEVNVPFPVNVYLPALFRP